MNCGVKRNNNNNNNNNNKYNYNLMLGEVRNNRPRGLVTHTDHSDKRFR